MTTDRTTKYLLAAITVLLLCLFVRPLLEPVPAQAQTKLMPTRYTTLTMDSQRTNESGIISWASGMSKLNSLSNQGWRVKDMSTVADSKGDVKTLVFFLERTGR